MLAPVISATLGAKRSHGTSYRLLNRNLWAPTHRTEPRSVEECERFIARPRGVSIFANWPDPHLVRDPAQRLIDADWIIAAHVERARDRGINYGRDCVLDVDIGSFLLTITKNLNYGRIRLDFVVEVSDVAAAIALPDHRREPKDRGLHPECVRVRRNQPFACHFRGAIQRRLIRDWRIFRSREYGAVAIH